MDSGLAYHVIGRPFHEELVTSEFAFDVRGTTITTRRVLLFASRVRVVVNERIHHYTGQMTMLDCTGQAGALVDQLSMLLIFQI